VHHRFRLALHPGRPRTSPPQHLRVIEAVCAVDAGVSGAAMRAHPESVVTALPQVEPDGPASRG
jgi:DNA-binding GntR family transcriptional regulator